VISAAKKIFMKALLKIPLRRTVASARLEIYLDDIAKKNIL